MQASSSSIVRLDLISHSRCIFSPPSADIHFQYNGFLFGIFILSIALIIAEKQILAAAVFAALLNFKHIYLYVAPVYFIYLFRAYCFPESGPEGKKKRSFSFGRLVGLGVVVAVVFAISLGPFAIKGQLLQLKERLFPFKRGLVHAYWAPNFWALYVAADRVARVALKYMGINLPGISSGASATSGLVGVGSFSVLPDIAPIVTFIATFLSMLPVLLHLWRKPVRENFIPALVHCGMCSFMLGWHVHEKAILLPVIPLGLIASENIFQRRMFVLMATVGHFGLFPLLFNSTETPIKIFLLLGHTTLSVMMLQASWKDFSLLDKIMIAGLVPVQAFYSVIHAMIFGKNIRYEFLPLFVVSAYCAAVLVLLWIQYAVGILRNRAGQSAKKKTE
jgi:alpha-1,3-glucosyltransferase